MNIELTAQICLPMPSGPGVLYSKSPVVCRQNTYGNLDMRLKISGLAYIVSPAILILGLVLNVHGECRYDSLIVRARALSYNAQFTEADSLLREAENISPDSAEGNFEMSQIQLWIYLFTGKDAAYDNFEKLSDITVAKLKKILKANPDDYHAAYRLGDTYFLKAVAGVSRHSYLSSFWAVKAASHYYNETLKLSPDFYDAYRGVGEIDYFLDFLPGSVRWSMPLFGLQANKAKGLSELILAYEKGTTDKFKTAVSLAQVYSNYVAEYDSAEVLMRSLVDKFPRNPMFNYDLGVLLIKKHDLNEAQKYIDTVLDLNDSNFVVLNRYSLFLKGDIYFKMNDFRKAIKYNRMFLKLADKPDYTGIANYRMAICYRALGNDSLMRKSLSAAMHGNQSIYDDARAKYRSEMFMKTGISKEELLTLEMKNDVAAGNYEKAYAVLKPTAGTIQNRDTRAEALLVLSDAADHIGKYVEAVRFATRAVSTGVGHDESLQATAWYQAAMGYYGIGNLSAAKAYLQKAKDTSEYKADNILYALINNLNLRLDRKRYEASTNRR